MISEEQKNYILKNKKWSFEMNDIPIRYGIFIPILIFGFILFTYIIRKYSIMVLTDFLNTGIMLLILTLCFIFCLKKIKAESRFEEIVCKRTNIEIIESVSKNWNELKWILKSNDESSIVFSDIIVGFRQENIITIIKNSDCTLLINSRSNGNQPFTIWRNNKNLLNLINILN